MEAQSPLKPWEQLPMYAVSEELAPRITALELERNLTELQADGYTVVRVDKSFTDRLRTAILRASEDAPAPNSTFERACGQLLGTDPVFSEACTHPAVIALAEFMCGRGAQLGALLGTVRGPGSAISLHSDQSWLASPFPDHNAAMTACWITDDFTRENGATCVVPGTQNLRRPPSPDEARDRFADALPIEAPAGSIAIWDGAVWHGNVPRTAPGERVVLHVTYHRLAYRRFHDFSYIGDDFRASASPEMRALLGENIGFGTNTRFEHFDGEKLMRMSGDSRR